MSKTITLSLTIDVPAGTNANNILKELSTGATITDIRSNGSYIYVLTENGGVICIPAGQGTPTTVIQAAPGAAPSADPNVLSANWCAPTTASIS
ncbi:MAG: hypothetical protein AAGB51_06165 [Planctomycetota bacterium]